jgi:hypothetical protein
MPAWRPAPGATGDPGTCGPARRPALSELDLRPMRTISGLRPWWLGPSFAGLIPSEVHAESDRGYLAYDDCVRFDRDRCPLSVELGEGSVCEDQRLVLALGRGRGAPRRSRRALLVGRPDYGRLAVLAGRTVVDLGSGGVEGSAAAMRNVRRAVRALRPLGLREAARRLPVGHAELRDRLRLLDALRAGGRLRTVRCGR